MKVCPHNVIVCIFTILKFDNNIFSFWKNFLVAAILFYKKKSENRPRGYLGPLNAFKREIQNKKQATQYENV